MVMAKKKDTYFSTSLHTGLRVLSLFIEKQSSFSQTEISKHLGLNMTSTYRYVNTLVRLGYLERGSKSKRLRLGLQCMALGTNFLKNFDSLKEIKSLVNNVHERYGMTIDVAFVVDNALMNVHRCEAQNTLIFRLPSVSHEWHATSLGKAYLSHISETALIEIIENIDLIPKTPNTIVEREHLLSELKKTKQRGYSRANEEFLAGLITIGAPLINLETNYAVGAVSFDFSTIQFNLKEVERNYAEILKELAHSLSKVITVIEPSTLNK
jgi:DNA-binding IclR family transcriptional regulator